MPWSRELLDFAKEFGERIGSTYGSVVLGRDFRTTGDPLEKVMSSTITASGADVYLVGQVPTPTLAYATKDFEAGVMITASHNPPEYNGIKLWNPDGSAFSEEQFKALNSPKIAPWSEVGKVKEINALQLHREALLKEFSSLGIMVVIDCANGATSVLTPFVFRDLGVRVITLNCHTSGSFPGHPSEPSEENLEDLKRMVVSTGADLGIAHDGDGDRFIAVISSGRYLNGDLILATFLNVLGFRRVVAPVDSSMLLENFAEVIRVKVGDANVSHEMKVRGVEFGGENSGTQIFAKWRYTPDAIYAALKFAEIAQRVDVDELVSSFPEYHTVRKSLHYEDRGEMERKIERIVADYYVELVDGYRVTLDDAWFLIRFSGTEPKVRVTVEAEREDRAKEIAERIFKVLKE